MSSSTQYTVGSSYIMGHHAPQFGEYSLADEELHYGDREKKPHYALTETQYYGFFVPERNIHCFTWVWCHPNLNVVTGGTMAWQGIKSRSQACELFDYRSFMSMDVFKDSFTRYKLDNGLEVDMEEPGKRFRLRYDDPVRNNSFDVVQSAVSDPMVWPTSNHFEQVMQCKGHIILRGERHEVDCFSVRDRSFGEYRVEESVADLPPVYWITGTFDETFSFCVVGMDDPEHDAFWKDEFAAPAGAALRFGWIIADGQKNAIRSASVRTEYDRHNLFVRKMEILIVDMSGREFVVSGEVGAAAPYEAWMNVRVPIALTHWTCGDRKGVGEIQSLQYTDFIRRYSNI